MIQSCWVAVGSRSRAICGRAKLSTVLSTETSSTGSMSTVSAAQPRQPTRGASWPIAVSVLVVAGSVVVISSSVSKPSSRYSITMSTPPSIRSSP